MTETHSLTAIPLSPWRRRVDIAVAATALTVSLLPAAVIIPAMAVTMGHPILFRQERYGQSGKPFTMLKLRTMLDEADKHGKVRTSAERKHWFGDFLRKYSLDEIPQLWNVLRGDMTLIGPRPMWEGVNPTVEKGWAPRCRNVPGLTGFDQILPGSYNRSNEKKFHNDGVFTKTRENSSRAFRIGYDGMILLFTAKRFLCGRSDVTQPLATCRGHRQKNPLPAHP